MKLFYKILYNPFVNSIIRNVLYPFRSVLPFSIKIPINGVVTIPISETKSIKVTTNETSYINRIMFWEGVDSFEYTPLFKKIAPSLDCFVDIGANIGYYSLLACALNPNVIVYSFEPSYGPKHFLRLNKELNKFDNLLIQEVALSNSKGTIDFFEEFNPKYSYLEHHLGGVGSLEIQQNNFPVRKTTVETTTFDTFVAEQNISNIDLVKIDTEATEHIILQGSSNVISQIRPIFIIEVLFDLIEQQLQDLFNQHSYRFFWETSTGLLETQTLLRNEDNGFRNCFIVPAEKYHIIQPLLQKL